MVDINKNTDEYVCALFDEGLTDEETEQVIDLLMQDDFAEQSWRKAALLSDAVKSLNEPSYLKLDVSKSVMTKLAEQNIIISADQMVIKDTQKTRKNAANNQTFRFFGAAASVVLICTAVWNYWPIAQDVPSGMSSAVSERDIFNTNEAPDGMILSSQYTEEELQRQKKIGKYYLQQHQNALLTGMNHSNN